MIYIIRSLRYVVKNICLLLVSGVVAAFFPIQLFAAAVPDNCQWVTSLGEASIENRTPDETRAFSLYMARLAAIEKTGIKITGISLIKDFNLMADIIRSMADGYIIDEKIEEWQAVISQETKENFPLITYKVKLKACVAGAGEGDPYFKIQSSLNKNVFGSGEEARINITATRDCYINIFNLTADDRIKILEPTSIQLKESEKRTFPPEGFALIMDMPKDSKRVVECFIIVATRKPLNFKTAIGKTKEISVPEFYRALISIPSKEKAEEIKVYEVVKSGSML